MKFYGLIKWAIMTVSLILGAIALIEMLKFNALQDKAFLVDDKQKFIGSWVEPIPGNESAVQGFRLFADGSAESINMATLVYQAWKVKSDKLILTSQSIGNGLSFVSDESYDIINVSKKQLVLKNGEYQIIYLKEK